MEKLYRDGIRNILMLYLRYKKSLHSIKSTHHILLLSYMMFILYLNVNDVYMDRQIDCKYKKQNYVNAIEKKKKEIHVHTAQTKQKDVS